MYTFHPALPLPMHKRACHRTVTIHNTHQALLNQAQHNAQYI